MPEKKKLYSVFNMSFADCIYLFKIELTGNEARALVTCLN